MKKILSLVLAMMMVLSMANVAFAAPSDVTDKEQIKAVDALMSLGIVNGYEDGTYRPENIVTRAELAKMLVEALGQGSLVEGSESSFKDAKGKWYDGYVALAAGLEIVQGYPDGTFKGDNPVSYQEAVNMILRAVGYTDQSVNGGVEGYNPTKYKTLALSLGILNNVTFKNAGATRGDIASMVYNALTVERVVKNEKGLAEKIVVGKKLVEVPNSNPTVYREENVYEVLLEKLTTKANIDVTSSTKAVDGVDLTQYLGHNVTAFLSADGKVMFVEKSNSKVVTGKVVTSTATTVKIGTTTYTVSEAAVYFNGSTEGFTLNSNFALLTGADVKLVYKDGTTITTVFATVETADKQITTVYKTGAASLNGIALPLKDGKVDLSKITVTGDATTLEDIQKNDIVKVYGSIGNKVVKLLVVRDSAEGKIVETNNDGDKVVISGIGEKETVAGLDLSGNLGDEGTFYFDENGDIYSFVKKQSGTPSTTDYALIIETKDGVEVSSVMLKNPTVKVLNAAGKEVTYTIADNAKYKILTHTGGATSTTNASVYSATTPGALKLDIANGKVIKSVTVKDDKVTFIELQDVYTIGSQVDPKSKTFDVANNVVIFNTVGANSTVVTLEQLKAFGKVAANNFDAVYNANGDMSVIIVRNEVVIPQETDYALVVAQKRVLSANDKPIQELTVYINGEKHVYLTKEGLTNNYAFGRTIYELSIVNGVVANEPTPTTVTETAITVTSGSIKTITVDTVRERFTYDSVRYYMEEDAPIYILNDDEEFVRVGDLSDLTGYNFVAYVYHDNDNNVSNIVIVLD